MKTLILADKTDHPNGPGATSYVDLRSSEMEVVDFRAWMIREMRKMWPSDIKVDGDRQDQLHLGRSPDHEVQGETVQFAACASGRMANHVLTSFIPVHLARNTVIAKRELEEKALLRIGRGIALSAAARMKRPAAKR